MTYLKAKKLHPFYEFCYFFSLSILSVYEGSSYFISFVLPIKQNYYHKMPIKISNSDNSGEGTGIPQNKNGRQIESAENDPLSELSRECREQLNNERKLSRMSFKCISTVSHDFRTPISIIYANLQLLEYHDFQLDKETIEDAFTLSRMAIKSLLRVLDKVTVVDSINKGKLESKPSRVNVNTICRNLANDLNEAEVLPDRVKYIHDERISEIETDEYLFKSMFTHLIFNALIFSKKTSNVIFESQLMTDEIVRFIVKDSGIGLTPEQLQSLRVYFADLKNDHNEMIGLGLAIARECLVLLGGKLTINSETGKGSEFIVDLPVSAIEERGKYDHTE